MIQKDSDLTMINAGCEIPVSVREYIPEERRGQQASNPHLLLSLETGACYEIERLGLSRNAEAEVSAKRRGWACRETPRLSLSRNTEAELATKSSGWACHESQRLGLPRNAEAGLATKSRGWA